MAKVVPAAKFRMANSFSSVATDKWGGRERERGNGRAWQMKDILGWLGGLGGGSQAIQSQETSTWDPEAKLGSVAPHLAAEGLENTHVLLLLRMCENEVGWTVH